MIYLVCPFFRPEMGRRVWENFAKQTHPCRLVIVENGPAVGFFNHGLAGATILRSEQGVGRARQVGLDYVREQDGDFLMLDDDDYYGPLYVEEWAFNRDRATVVGKQAHHVLFPEGLYVYNEGRANAFSSDTIAGNTIGFRARDGCDFPDTNATNDHDWCELMRARGADFWCTSIFHHVYNRADGNNVSPGSKHLFTQLWGNPRGPVDMKEAKVF